MQHTIEKILEYLMSFGAYALGASLLIISIVEKYKLAADASPNPSAVYNKKVFWYKEKLNILRMIILGIISTIFLPRFMGGGTFVIENTDGIKIASMPVRAALAPVQLIIGYTGGALILAAIGKSKKDFYKKLGVDEKTNV